MNLQQLLKLNVSIEHGVYTPSEESLVRKVKRFFNKQDHADEYGTLKDEQLEKTFLDNSWLEKNFEPVDVRVKSRVIGLNRPTGIDQVVTNAKSLVNTVTRSFTLSYLKKYEKVLAEFRDEVKRRYRSTDPDNDTEVDELEDWVIERSRAIQKEYPDEPPLLKDIQYFGVDFSVKLENINQAKAIAQLLREVRDIGERNKELNYVYQIGYDFDEYRNEKFEDIFDDYLDDVLYFQSVTGGHLEPIVLADYSLLHADKILTYILSKATDTNPSFVKKFESSK